MRNVTLGLPQDDSIATSVGMTDPSIREMYRLMAIAKYNERYVIPKAHVERPMSLRSSVAHLSTDRPSSHLLARPAAAHRLSRLRPSRHCGKGRPLTSAFPARNCKVA